MARKKKSMLSPLENRVMNVLWERKTATADEVSIALSTKSQSMKDSTARTILRRLEEKGYVAHVVDGRTYVYSPRLESRNVATDAVRGIIEQFCSGSVEDLLVGMVNDEIVSSEKLKELAQRISKLEQRKPNSGGQS